MIEVVKTTIYVLNYFSIFYNQFSEHVMDFIGCASSHTDIEKYSSPKEQVLPVGRGQVHTSLDNFCSTGRSRLRSSSSKPYLFSRWFECFFASFGIRALTLKIRCYLSFAYLLFFFQKKWKKKFSVLLLFSSYLLVLSSFVFCVIVPCVVDCVLNSSDTVHLVCLCLLSCYFNFGTWFKKKFAHQKKKKRKWEWFKLKPKKKVKILVKYIHSR